MERKKMKIKIIEIGADDLLLFEQTSKNMESILNKNV